MYKDEILREKDSLLNHGHKCTKMKFYVKKAVNSITVPVVLANIRLFCTSHIHFW